MPRRNGSVNRRKAPEANHEKRGMRVFKAFRVMDAASSSLLAGLVWDAAREGELPPLRQVNRSHRVFLLDPHLVRREFMQGLQAGASLARELEEIQGRASAFDATIDIKLGDPSLVRSAKGRDTLVVRIESRELSKERLAFYKQLGKAGYTGFRRPANVSAPRFAVPVASFESPIRDRREIRQVEEGFENALIFSQEMIERQRVVELGAIVVAEQKVPSRRLA